MSRFAVGMVCALAGAALWGFSGACSQFLLANYNMTPVFMTLVRMLGAGAVFMAVIVLFHRQVLGQIVRDMHAMIQLLAFGNLGLLASQLTYVVSVSYTNAGTATVLQSASIVFVTAATCVMARRGPRLFEVLGLICAIAATVLIATKGQIGSLNMPPEGLCWGIVNAAVVAFYIMYPRRLFERFGSFAVTGCGMMLGGLCMAVLWGVLAAAGVVFGTDTFVGGMASAQVVVPSLDALGITVLLLLIFVGTFGAFALYLHGVSVVGGVNGSLLGTAEPASATIIAALWLGTAFSWGDWAGLALMIATIVLVALQPSRE